MSIFQLNPSSTFRQVRELEQQCNRIERGEKMDLYPITETLRNLIRTYNRENKVFNTPKRDPKQQAYRLALAKDLRALTTRVNTLSSIKTSDSTWAKPALYGALTATALTVAVIAYKMSGSVQISPSGFGSDIGGSTTTGGASHTDSTIHSTGSSVDSDAKAQLSGGASQTELGGVGSGQVADSSSLWTNDTDTALNQTRIGTGISNGLLITDEFIKRRNPICPLPDNYASGNYNASLSRSHSSSRRPAQTDVSSNTATTSPSVSPTPALSECTLRSVEGAGWEGRIKVGECLLERFDQVSTNPWTSNPQGYQDFLSYKERINRNANTGDLFEEFLRDQYKQRLLPEFSKQEIATLFNGQEVNQVMRAYQAITRLYPTSEVQTGELRIANAAYALRQRIVQYFAQLCPRQPATIWSRLFSPVYYVLKKLTPDDNITSNINYRVGEISVYESSQDRELIGLHLYLKAKDADECMKYLESRFNHSSNTTGV